MTIADAIDLITRIVHAHPGLKAYLATNTDGSWSVQVHQIFQFTKPEQYERWEEEQAA